MECRVYGQQPLPVWPVPEAESGPRRATWSFVNDTWADAVAETEWAYTGAIAWKDSRGDDFEEPDDNFEKTRRELEEIKAFHAPSSDEHDRRYRLVADMEKNAEAAEVCKRVFNAVREGCMIGVLRLRRDCVVADGECRGQVPERVFMGILATLGVHLPE